MAIPWMEYPTSIHDESDDPRIWGVRQQLDDIAKKRKGAQLVAAFLAFCNYALGLYSLFKALSGGVGFVDGPSAIFLVIMGVFLLGVMGGIRLNIRLAVVAALAFIVLDTVATVFTGELLGGNIVMWCIMRFIFISSLISAIRPVFRYHSLRRQYVMDANPAMRELFLPVPVKTHSAILLALAMAFGLWLSLFCLWALLLFL